MKYGEMSSI